MVVVTGGREYLMYINKHYLQLKVLTIIFGYLISERKCQDMQFNEWL